MQPLHGNSSGNAVVGVELSLTEVHFWEQKLSWKDLWMSIDVMEEAISPVVAMMLFWPNDAYNSGEQVLQLLIGYA